jgi:hypothetical protein
MNRWIRCFHVLPAPIMIAVWLVSAATVFLAGCSYFSSAEKETKQLYKEIGGSKGSLLKTLVILPFEKNEQWSQINLTTPFLEELKSAIEKKSSHIRVLLPDDPGYPDRYKQPIRLKDGEIDNYALALAGRAAGVNMVLAGRLVDIRYITEDHGMAWWAKTRHLARIQVNFSVYHTSTAAKLMDQTILKDLKIKESEGLQIQKNEMPDTVMLADSLHDIAKTIAKMGDMVFKYIPWEAHITDVSGDQLVLSSGKSVGLKKGKVLDVFNNNKVTRGRSGRRFFMEGSKIGTITLTAVYPDHSEAVLKEGGPIPPGSVVRLP